METLNARVQNSPQFQSLTTNTQLHRAPPHFGGETMFPSVTKSKAYNDNFRSLGRTAKRFEQQIRSNESLQAIQQVEDDDSQPGVLSAAAPRGQEGPNKQASSNMEILRSPHYLVTDGSLVNLGEIARDAHQDSTEHLSDLADNLKRIRSIQELLK